MNIDVNNLDAQQMERMKHVVTSAFNVPFEDVSFRNNQQEERLEFSCHIKKLHAKEIYIPYKTVQNHNTVDIAKTIIDKAWQFFKGFDEGVLDTDLEFRPV